MNFVIGLVLYWLGMAIAPYIPQAGFTAENAWVFGVVLVIVYILIYAIRSRE